MWTKEKPTKEGYYWLRNIIFQPDLTEDNTYDWSEEKPQIVKFRNNRIYYIGDEMWMELRYIEAEWSEILLPD